MTHICDEPAIIGSDHGLSPGRRQSMIWTNAEILLIGPLGTNVSAILIGTHTFSFKKMHLKMSSAKWHPLFLGLNVLKTVPTKWDDLCGLVGLTATHKEDVVFSKPMIYVCSSCLDVHIMIYNVWIKSFTGVCYESVWYNLKNHVIRIFVSYISFCMLYHW